VGQFIGHAIFLQIRDIVIGVIDAPFFEVATENLALMMTARLRD
jgi:hypothetical protein